MNKNSISIDAWLEEQLTDTEEKKQVIWDPGFDVERRVVYAKLGPYQKIFLRPSNYHMRFYHKVYPLTVESWQLLDQREFYDGFCTICIALDIRFQATLKYVRANFELLPDINPTIKRGYEGLVRDIIDKEMLELQDGEWIDNGLVAVARSIENAVNESLMIKNIQCRTICSLKPSFKELTEAEALDGRFAHESVYLNVLQKNFKFREKQNQELFRQQEQMEYEKQEQQRKQMEFLNEEDAIYRHKQMLQSENTKRQLQEKQEQLKEQHEIERRLHEEELKHKQQLRELDLETSIKEQEKQLIKKLQLERKLATQKREQQAYLKEKEAEIEIQEYEKQQEKWNEAKLRLQQEQLKQEERLKQKELEIELKAQERRQAQQYTMDEQLEIARLKHKSRLNHLKLESELQEQQKRFETTQQADEYLRREIEHLVLEKQRAELNQAIKQTQIPETLVKQEQH